MQLIRANQPELDITDEMVRNVALAGLNHDLGHGPFSHTFDNQFIYHLQTLKGITDKEQRWTHE